MKGKPKVTRMRQHTLHRPPQEVVDAPSGMAAWWASRTPCELAEMRRLTRQMAAQREFERNGKMPAHQPARPACLYTDQNGAKCYETAAEFEARKRRLANRKAGKKFL